MIHDQESHRNRKKPDVYGNNTLNTHGMEDGRKRGKKGKGLTKMTPLTCHVLQKKHGREEGGGTSSSLTDLSFSTQVAVVAAEHVVLPTRRKTPDWISVCYQVNHPITSHGCDE